MPAEMSRLDHLVLDGLREEERREALMRFLLLNVLVIDLLIVAVAFWIFV